MLLSRNAKLPSSKIMMLADRFVAIEAVAFWVSVRVGVKILAVADWVRVNVCDKRPMAGWVVT